MRYADASTAHKIAPKVGAGYADTADAQILASKIVARWADAGTAHKIAPKTGAGYVDAAQNTYTKLHLK